MLAEERKIKIIELLSHQNTISVNEIEKVLNATSVTIRKDLSELESEGKLQRIHGGAIAIEKVGEIFKDKDLEIRAPKEKKAIARYAYGFIENNDTILLDSSTTARELTKLIQTNGKKNLTIFTNSIYNAMILSENESCNLVMIGGTINPSLRFATGHFSEDFISRVRVDKCFLGTNGIDREFGFSVTNIEDASLKRKMVESSRQLYILADSSKFNKVYLMTFAKFNESLTALITDSKISNQIIQQYNPICNLLLAPIAN